MATTTPNLGLTKPAVSDAADISVLNANFDILDAYAMSNQTKQIDDWNAAIYNGPYRSSASAINGPVAGSQYHGMMINYSSVLGNQFAFKTWGSGSEMWTRRYYNGAFEPWECLNPPMALGVEYRTTERWQGKAVYTVLVDCGTIVAGENTVSTNYACTNVIGSRGTSGSVALPMLYESARYDKYFRALNVSKASGKINIVIEAGSSVSATSPNYVQVWYTKD